MSFKCKLHHSNKFPVLLNVSKTFSSNNPPKSAADRPITDGPVNQQEVIIIIEGLFVIILHI